VTPNDLETVRQIQDAIRGTGKIPASQVRAWLHNPSVEVLGAVTEGIMRGQTRRVEPPLSMEEICSTVQGVLQGVFDPEFPRQRLRLKQINRWT